MKRFVLALLVLAGCVQRPHCDHLTVTRGTPLDPTCIEADGCGGSDSRTMPVP